MRDVERLRLLRNECRKSMTRDTKVVGKERQKKWWRAETRRAYLLIDGDDALGFVYIRREHGANWITLGLTESARGAGLGTMLYHTFRPCRAEIDAENTASLTAATRAGYLPTLPQLGDTKVVMVG